MIGDGSTDWTPAWLERARRRRSVLVAAGLVWLGLAWFHWLGLVVGGALVGLASRTVPRAMGAGVGFGVAALTVTVLLAPSVGVAEFFALTPLSFTSVVAAVVAPVWGALVRVLV